MAACWGSVLRGCLFFCLCKATVLSILHGKKSHTGVILYRSEGLEEKKCVHSVALLAWILIFQMEFKRILEKTDTKKHLMFCNYYKLVAISLVIKAGYILYASDYPIGVLSNSLWDIKPSVLGCGLQIYLQMAYFLYLRAGRALHHLVLNSASLLKVVFILNPFSVADIQSVLVWIL